MQERFLVPGYYIERLLARGGMGKVYFARRRDFGTPVAVKVLSAGSPRSEHFRRGFIREACLMAAVRHPNDEERKAFLCDLGLALPVGGHINEGVLSETPHYMSPKQARGSTNPSPKGDVYSLAAALYHMLNGEPLLETETPEQVAVKQIRETPQFPEGPSKEIRSLLMRTLEKDPTKRPSSSDVATTLKALYEGRKTPRHPALFSLFLPFLNRWWWVFALGSVESC